MTAQRALVSVVIPAYNVARYLGTALDSVFRQTYSSLDVVVVDDGSTDGTWMLLETFGNRVTAIRQERRGIGGARNAGVAAARGDFLAFLDADDLYTPTKVERQLACLQQDDHLDMVFGHVEEFISEEMGAGERSRLIVRPGAQAGYLASTMLVRREAFGRVGAFGDWRTAEFLDWYLKALESGLRARMLPDVVLRRRLHQTNTGRVERHSRADFARVLKASLDRRRAADLSTS